MTDTNNIFNFDDFALNLAHRELTFRGTPVEIEPRAFEVLIYLVMNRGRAVDKNELQDAVWPGMIVTETALTRAVMKARKAIGDDANRQEKIKTLHGHGYRFIAELSTENITSVPGTQAPPVSGQQVELTDPRNLSFRTRTLIGLAVVLIVSMAWMLFRPGHTLGNETRIAILPLIDNTKNQDLAWTSLGLMSYANKLIASDGSLDFVPAGSIIGLTDNFGWSGNLDDPANQTLLSKLEQVYGATHILSMELETAGGALRMNYGLLSPDGTEHKGTMVGDGGTDLAHGVVQAIYGVMLRKSHQGGATLLVSEDAFNNEAFARGMALSLKGRCAEAVQFFEVIIEQEPGLFAPRFEYAACLRILGESDRAETLLIALVEEQRLPGTERPLARSLMTLGILYNRTGRLDEAEQSYKEALQISEDTGDHILKARILQNLSIVLKDRSHLDGAENLLNLAILAYQDAGREILPGQLYSGRANLKMARGELVEAEVDLDMALRAFREIGDRRNEAMMLNNTGYLRRRQGRVDEAEDYHLRSLEIREEIGDRVGVGRIYGMLSSVYSSQGKYLDAISAAESALEIARETRDRLFEATSLAQLAAANKALGEHASARMYYLEARNVFVAIQDIKRTLETDLKIAQLDMIANLSAQAESTALRVLAASREHDIMSSEVQAMELLGDIELKRGNTTAAIIEFSDALTRVRKTTWTSKEISLNTKLANALLDQMKLEAAAPLVGALSEKPTNVQSLKVQARFAFLRGESDSAVRLMSEAKTLAGEHWADESESTLQKYRAKNE